MNSSMKLHHQHLLLHPHKPTDTTCVGFGMNVANDDDDLVIEQLSFT